MLNIQKIDHRHKRNGSHSGSQRRRKSEATTNRDEDHAPKHREGGRRRVLKVDHQGAIIYRMAWIQKRNERAPSMRAFPLFSQKAMFKDWISEFVCWFRKFDTWPLSDVLDKMIWMLGKPQRNESDRKKAEETEERKL